jgi:hypothetical protein
MNLLFENIIHQKLKVKYQKSNTKSQKNHFTKFHLFDFRSLLLHEPSLHFSLLIKFGMK